MRSSEIEQLENFKHCLNLKNKIGTTRNGDVISYRVQFGDVQFYRWLMKIGLFPHKTYDIGSIAVPDKYFRDFLRGHLDGDGSITTYTDYYNTFKNPKYVYERMFVRFISASKTHILWLKDKILKNFHVDGPVHEAKTKIENHVSIYVIKFGKKESIKLLKQIYYDNDIPCLTRKRNIAEKFIK